MQGARGRTPAAGRVVTFLIRYRWSFYFILFIVAAAGLFLLVGRVTNPTGRDLELDSAPSPGGRLLAQLWCMGVCADRQNVVLTISWAGSLNGTRNELTARGVVADAPDRDIVARFTYRGDRPALQWLTAKHLAVHGSCLSDPHGAPIADVKSSAAHVSFRQRRAGVACG